MGDVTRFSDSLTRRQALIRAGVGAGGVLLAGAPELAAAARVRRRGVPVARTGDFAAGVAAGQPTPRGITLWTRLGGYQRDRKVFLEIARDEDFRRLVYRRPVVARASRDHTLAVRIEGRRLLDPGERYFYRFETRTVESPVGRFRTPRPPDSREPVRIGFWSCQAWEAGYYGAHAALAREEDLDLVIGLGDYIYERAFGFEGPDDRADTQGPNRDGDVQTLPEYRSKYRMYRSDENLRAMHAAHAFVATWDDHEVSDNYAGDQQGPDDRPPRVPWHQRRANGYRAFHEYMPILYGGGDRFRVHRRFSLGRTVEVFMLDERQHRDEAACNGQILMPCPQAESDDRTMLGPAQKQWLMDGLAGSRATWKVVGNPVMMMALDSVPGVAIDRHVWDGYGRERREILGHVQAAGVANVSFITGAIHTFFAGDVGVDGRGPESVATEFVGGSITTTGIPESIAYYSRGAISKEDGRHIAERIRDTNPHIRYADYDRHGYAVLEARPDELLVTFRAVDRMSPQPGPADTIARFRVAAGQPRVQLL